MRPHVKSHKCPDIAKLQIVAGACGVCCATVKELEAMTAADIGNVLLTAPFATPETARRIAAAHHLVPSVMVVVDHETGVECIANAASTDRPIGVLVEINVGQNRTGVTDPARAVLLARKACDHPALRFRGVQAYYGQLQGVQSHADRQARVKEQWQVIARYLAAFADAGLKLDIISGGGTGTHALDLGDSPFTEIQAGSYVFMDSQYDKVELTPTAEQRFVTALTVAARIVSVEQPRRAIADAGFKAMATDQGAPVIWRGVSGPATCRFMGDEHSAIDVADDGSRPALGALVEFQAPHCDPTVNLYDVFHVVEDGRLVALWPITGRGY